MNFSRLFLLFFIFHFSIKPSNFTKQFVKGTCFGVALTVGAVLFNANHQMNKLAKDEEIEKTIALIESNDWKTLYNNQQKQKQLTTLMSLYRNKINFFCGNLFFGEELETDAAWVVDNIQLNEEQLNEKRSKLIEYSKEKSQFGPLCFFTLGGCLILHEFFNTK